MKTNPTSARPFLANLATLIPLIPLSVFLAACGGGGGGDAGPSIPTTPTVSAYVGDDVGDYTFKYTAAFQGYKMDGKPYGNHYGYREPNAACKYLQEDVDDYKFGKANKIVLGEYAGTKLNPAKEGDQATSVYAYRESYDFKAIDKTHMSFTHKISLYPTTRCYDDNANAIKRGEITRTGENTTKPTITNPRGAGTKVEDYWDYFLLQRTGTTMFTWTGKTKLPTGEEVDMFDVDLPELTNRNWDFQKWDEVYTYGAGIKLSHPLFNGRNKAKALVYMKRNADDKSNPWSYGTVQMIMDSTNYMTSTPLSQWQKFDFFSPEYEDKNKYDLPN
jgi:hypothetical protein